MEIQLDNDLWLTSDSSNYMFAKKSKQKNKATGEVKDILVPFKYYTTLASALKAYLELSVKCSSAKSFEKLHSALEASRRKCEAITAAFDVKG